MFRFFIVIMVALLVDPALVDARFSSKLNHCKRKIMQNTKCTPPAKPSKPTLTQTIRCSSTTVTTPTCGPNQEYSECGNNGCQNTCENPTLSQVCRGICIPGCICAPGFLKNSNGICVLRAECESSTSPSPTCRTYEVYSECGDVGCQPTCDNPNQACVPPCASGCVCVPGFVRDPSGNCVRLNLCEV